MIRIRDNGAAIFIRSRDTEAAVLENIENTKGKRGKERKEKKKAEKIRESKRESFREMLYNGDRSNKFPSILRP